MGYFSSLQEIYASLLVAPHWNHINDIRHPCFANLTCAYLERADRQDASPRPRNSIMQFTAIGRPPQRRRVSISTASRGGRLAAL